MADYPRLDGSRFEITVSPAGSLLQEIARGLGVGWYVESRRSEGEGRTRIRAQHPQHGVYEVPLDDSVMASRSAADLANYVVTAICNYGFAVTALPPQPQLPAELMRSQREDEARAREAEEEARRIVLDAIQRRSAS